MLRRGDAPSSARFWTAGARGAPAGRPFRCRRRGQKNPGLVHKPGIVPMGLSCDAFRRLRCARPKRGDLRCVCCAGPERDALPASTAIAERLRRVAQKRSARAAACRQPSVRSMSPSFSTPGMSTWPTISHLSRAAVRSMGTRRRRTPSSPPPRSRQSARTSCRRTPCRPPPVRRGGR